MFRIDEDSTYPQSELSPVTSKANSDENLPSKRTVTRTYLQRELSLELTSKENSD